MISLPHVGSDFNLILLFMIVLPLLHGLLFRVDRVTSKDLNPLVCLYNYVFLRHWNYELYSFCSSVFVPLDVDRLTLDREHYTYDREEIEDRLRWLEFLF